MHTSSYNDSLTDRVLNLPVVDFYYIFGMWYFLPFSLVWSKSVFRVKVCRVLLSSILNYCLRLLSFLFLNWFVRGLYWFEVKNKTKPHIWWRHTVYHHCLNSSVLQGVRVMFQMKQCSLLKRNHIITLTIQVLMRKKIDWLWTPIEDHYVRRQLTLGQCWYSSDSNICKIAKNFSSHIFWSCLTFLIVKEKKRSASV